MKMDRFLSRPLLRPELPRIWRDADTFQLGITPERGVILTHMTPTLHAALKRMDGEHSMRELLHMIEEHDEDPNDFAELFTELAHLGVLDVLPVQNNPEFSMLIETNGAIGPALGALLAGAGVDKIHITASPQRTHQYVTRDDISSAGISIQDLQAPYLTAARTRLRDENENVDTSSFSFHEAQCVLIADLTPGDIVHTQKYLEAGIPHLPVSLVDGLATVGPLVLPGYTACLRCVEEHRCDTDALWPAVTAQLRTGHTPPHMAHSLNPSPVMATQAASLAATQVLAWIRGREPEALGTILECEGEGGEIRRTPIERHPMCSWH